MIHFRTLGAVDLRDEHGDELRLALAQPKRLALLAYLAIATPAGFHRRDVVRMDPPFGELVSHKI